MRMPGLSVAPPSESECGRTGKGVTWKSFGVAFGAVAKHTRMAAKASCGILAPRSVAPWTRISFAGWPASGFAASAPVSGVEPSVGGTFVSAPASLPLVDPLSSSPHATSTPPSTKPAIEAEAIP